ALRKNSGTSSTCRFRSPRRQLHLPLDSRNLRLARGSRWPHDENRVAKGIDDIECPRAPDLVLRWTPNVDAALPLLVVGVGVLYFQRHACFPAVTRHRAIKRDINRASLQAQEPVLAVLR